MTPRVQSSCVALSPSWAITAETPPALPTLPPDLGLRPRGRCLMKRVKRAIPPATSAGPEPQGPFRGVRTVIVRNSIPAASRQLALQNGTKISQGYFQLWSAP